jgi:small conductance mechanosensitive channel
MTDVNGIALFSVEWLKTSGVSILITIVIAVCLIIVLRRLLPPVIHKTMKMKKHGLKKEIVDKETEKRAQTLSSFIVKAFTVIIVIIALFSILPELGINIAAALAGVGIAGLAIGFAAQDLVRDCLNGIFILLEDQYRVGDVVNIAGIGGSVEEVGIRRTILRDLNGVVHSIPNGEVKIASNLGKKYSRINLNVPVSYGEDLNHVIDVINRVCKEMAESPEWKKNFINVPSVLRVDNFGDSGIEIKVLGDTVPLQQWAATGELRLRLKKAFDREGIEIPWPHAKVYFGDSPLKVEGNYQGKANHGSKNSE